MIGDCIAGTEVEHPFGPKGGKDDESGIRDIQPQDFYRQSLANGIRLDLRKFMESREAVLAAGDTKQSDGFATAKYGETIVTCSVKAELARPRAVASDRGWATITVDLENADIRREIRRDGEEEETETSHTTEIFLMDALRQILDFRDLCVKKGELTWVLHLEVNALSLDGNFRDVSMLATLGAIENVTLPMVKYKSGEQDTQMLDELVKLRIIRRMYPFSFLIEEKSFLFDPTAAEEGLSPNRVTVCLDDDGNLCGFESWGCPDDEDEPISMAVEKAKQLLPDVKARVQSARENASEPVPLLMRCHSLASRERKKEQEALDTGPKETVVEDGADEDAEMLTD